MRAAGDPAPASAPRRAFVIGHPVAHSRSPLMHGHWLEALGIAGSYERIDVRPEDLAAFLADLPGRGFVGGNVTVPHKEAVFRLVGEASPEAHRLGAVNTLRLGPGGVLHGDDTDPHGFSASLAESLGPGWAREAGIAIVIGAGGAARAALAACLDGGIGRVVVANRSPERATALAAFDPDRVLAVDLGDLGRHLGGAGLLVNATSLGMVGQPPLEVDVAGLPAHAVVTDLVYVPLETALLRAARTRGLRVVDGLGMLLHQAVPGFESWFGVRPPVTPELRGLLVRSIEGAG